MFRFNENLLQFIWQYKLLTPKPLVTVSGNEILILRTGTLNTDAGPDFFNAQVRINDIVLSGNIEVHINSSDWLKHRHQDNKNYDTIILHVVYEYDVAVLQNSEHNVEVLELKHYIAPQTLERYHDLSQAKETLACAGQLKGADDLKFISWLDRMAVERLEEKVRHIDQLYATFNGDHTQVFYALLLRNFGFSINALPFEMIAAHLPVQILLKHADNLMQLEALLLGASGLLENQFEDKYICTLQNEFEYLKTKYRLTTLQQEIFKFSRLRPANFPGIRLAQLALIIHKRPDVLTNPQAITTLTQLKQALDLEPEGYWKHHYTLNGEETSRTIALGEESIEKIAINTFAPFFFFYGEKLMRPEFTDLALVLLQECRAESNAKTKLYASKKRLVTNAANSQGLIHLHDKYCLPKQCLKCGVAAAILRSA